MPTTTAYERTMRAARADVLRVRHTAEDEIAAHYQSAAARLHPAFNALASRYGLEQKRLLDEAKANADEGGPVDAPRVPQTWLIAPHGGNLPALQAEVRTEMDAFGRLAFMTTQRAHGAALDTGDSAAQKMLVQAIKPIAELLPADAIKPANAAALRALQGEARPGGPVDALFHSFGPDAAADIRSTLAAGLITGASPNTLADMLVDSLGGSYSRAVTIARTTTIRAWHDAALANYRANDDVVGGWIWMADKAGRTCAACLAMDGSIHGLDEDIDDHPQGRCAKGPVTKSYGDILSSYGIDTSDMDLPDPPWASYQSGQNWLDDQDAATQRQVFGGQAAYNAYKAGDADLSDFATVRDGGAWGESIQQASLRSMGLEASDYAGD